MLRILKFDFHKLIKSRAIKIFLYVGCALIFTYNLFSYAISKNNDAVFENLYSSVFSLTPLLVIIFAIFLTTKDYNSRYINNILGSVNKFEYILSKLIYILAYCFSLQILNFISNVIGNYIFGAGIIYNAESSYTFSEFIVYFFMQILVLLSISSVIVLLSTIFRNITITFIIALVYFLFLSQFLYSVIDKLIGGDFTIEKYLVFSAINNLYNSMGDSNNLLLILSIQSAYVLITLLLSWFILAQNNFK